MICDKTITHEAEYLLAFSRDEVSKALLAYAGGELGRTFDYANLSKLTLRVPPEEFMDVVVTAVFQL